MSLYNRLFGENEDTVPLLGMLGLTRENFKRFRDIYLNKEGNIITVLTRLGGGNREDYQEVFDEMEHHENYIGNIDDEFDNTYCYFMFTVPEKYIDTCRKIAPKEDRLSVGGMFKKEVEEASVPGSDASKRMQAIADQLMSAIENGKHFIGM